MNNGASACAGCIRGPPAILGRPATFKGCINWYGKDVAINAVASGHAVWARPKAPVVPTKDAPGIEDVKRGWALAPVVDYRLLGSRAKPNFIRLPILISVFELPGPPIASRTHAGPEFAVVVFRVHCNDEVPLLQVC